MRSLQKTESAHLNSCTGGLTPFGTSATERCARAASFALISETLRARSATSLVSIPITRAFYSICASAVLLPCLIYSGANPPTLPISLWVRVLPVGAYVTLEHEYILIARKGARRVFSSEREKKKRRESALFWEERNVWYSDVWTDLTGTGQGLSPGTARSRSAAYPFELAYRLINMFSLKNDTVLDPFLGTGTTLLASMASQRHSVGFELDTSLRATIEKGCASIVDQANDYIRARLERHAQFVADREVKHRNRRYGFGVVSAQERDIKLNALSAVSAVGDDEYEVRYAAKSDASRPVSCAY